MLRRLLLKTPLLFQNQLLVLPIQFVDAEIPAGNIDGKNTQFTLSHFPNPIASLILTRNGLVLKLGTDFTVGGNVVNFVLQSVPQPNDLIQGWYRFSV